MTRILHVFKTFWPDAHGGVIQVMHDLGSRHAAAGHEVTLLALGSRDEDVRRDGYRLVRVRSGARFAGVGLSMRALGRFAKLARSVDVVHYHAPSPMCDLMHLLCRPDVVSVVTFHSDVVKHGVAAALYQRLFGTFLARVDRIVATSEPQSRTSGILADKQSRVRVIPLGIDVAPALQADSTRVSAMRTSLGGKFLLFVGVLRAYKGLHVLLEAVRGTGLRVVVAGDGPLRGELEARIRSEGLTGVQLVGEVSEERKWELLHACAGVVLPSNLRSEAFGIVLLEGGACGRPLVSCELGTGTSYANLDGVTGLVVPPDDPVALRAAMLRLFEDDRLAADLGAAARSRVLEEFTVDRMAARYMALYEELLAK